MSESNGGHRAEPSEAVRPRIGMIWAQSTNGVIGRDGSMPWSLPEDMRHFKNTTMGHPVVMGRKTWESVPARFRPFTGRTNIVLTSRAETAAEVEQAGATAAGTLEEALEAARSAEGSEEVWIIGGGHVYGASLGLADTALVTVINRQMEGDTFAPELDGGWTRKLSEPTEGWTRAESGLEYRIELWEKAE